MLLLAEAANTTKNAIQPKALCGAGLPPRSGQDPDGQHEPQRKRHPEQHPERAVQPVVAVDREQDGHDRDHHSDHDSVPSEDLVEALSDDDRVEDGEDQVVNNAKKSGRTTPR